MKTNTDMTLYARGIDSSLDESWIRTAIKDVLWINETAVAEAIATNFVSVHISTYNRTLPDIKPRDILVKGLCTKSINVAGYTMRTLQLNYETVEVKSVVRHDYGSPGMQHIVIQAR